MGRQTLEELKQTYPRLWQKASREFEDEDARKKAFLALVELQKAKVKERIIREKLRKKRTRALILFATGLIRELDQNELKNLIQRIRKHLIAREGRSETDYLPFLLQEVKQVHPNFEIENISAEEIKKQVTTKLQNEFEKGFKKASEKALQKIKSHP